MSNKFETFGGSKPEDKNKKKKFSIAEPKSPEKNKEEREIGPKLEKVEVDSLEENIGVIHENNKNKVKPQEDIRRTVAEALGEEIEETKKEEPKVEEPKPVVKTEKDKGKIEKHPKEKKSKEQGQYIIEEYDKDIVFQGFFSFESQREVDIPNLPDLSKKLTLWSQNGPVFTRMEELIKNSNRSDKEEHLKDFNDLKQYFQANSLEAEFKSKVKDNPLANALLKNVNTPEKEVDKEEFASKVRDLLYLYDRYQKPALIQDLKNIPKDDLKFKRKGNKGKKKKQYKVIDLNPQRDFLVKAFPFLNLTDQATVYNALVTDPDQVLKKVNLPDKYIRGKKLTPAKRLKILTSMKYRIIDDLVHVPIKDLKDLHEVELEKLRPLVNHMVGVKARGNSMKDKAQYNRLKKIKKALNKEIHKNKEKRLKPELLKRIPSQADSVRDRYKNLNKRLDNHPEIQDGSLEKLHKFINSFDINKDPLIYKLLVEKKKNREKYLKRASVKQLNKISNQLSKLRDLIKEGNKFVNKFLERAKVEETIRPEIREKVPHVDLRAVREVWRELDLDPTDISIKFAKDDMLPYTATKMQKQVDKVLVEELPDKDLETLRSIDFKLDFYDIYYKLDREKIFNELPEEEHEQVLELVNIVESDASTQEKNKAYKELKNISKKALDIAGENLKEELVAFATESELEKAQESFENLIAADTALEKFKFYKEMQSME